MDKREDIIKPLILILFIIKRTHFAKNKKLKSSTNKFYKSKKKFLERAGAIFIKIIKIYILILIKDLIIFKIISLK